jgi:hypothetical protein
MPKIYLINWHNSDSLMLTQKKEVKKQNRKKAN